MKKILLLVALMATMVAVAWGIGTKNLATTFDGGAICVYDCMQECKTKGKDDKTCDHECQKKCADY